MTQASQTANSKSCRWLFWCIVAYCTMNGAQLWETIIFIPAWTAAPPATLHFFNGPHGVDLKGFWIIVHSCHDLIFIIALAASRREPGKRTAMLLLFIAHMAVRVWTLVYFAPAIMEFQAIAPSGEIDPTLVAKAAIWKNLNYLRVALFCIINLLLISLFIKTKTINNE